MSFSITILVGELELMISLEIILLVFTAITSLIAAVTGVLRLRRHVELPAISAKTVNRSESTDLLNREIQFKQLTNPSIWVVNEVKTSTFGEKWMCITSDPVWNDYGEFLGYRQESAEWSRCLKFNPPIRDGEFLLHPDAPHELILSFKVALRGQSRIKRKIKVFLE